MYSLWSPRSEINNKHSNRSRKNCDLTIRTRCFSHDESQNFFHLLALRDTIKKEKKRKRRNYDYYYDDYSPLATRHETQLIFGLSKYLATPVGY